MAWGFPFLLMLFYWMTALLFWRVHRQQKPVLWALIALASTVQLHGLWLYFSLRQEQVWDLSIFKVVSLYAWSVAACSLFWLRRPAMALAGVVLCAINAPLVLLPSLLVSQKAFAAGLSQGMLWHIFFSLAAWTLLSIAFLHALLYHWLFQRLKHKQLNNRNLSLVGLEGSTVFFSEMAFLCLSASLLTGAAFVEDLWAQHLLHKTVLTGLAWLALLLLLGLQRKRFLRGMGLVYGLWGIFMLLLLGYVVSNVVLQFLLGR